MIIIKKNKYKDKNTIVQKYKNIIIQKKLDSKKD